MTVKVLRVSSEPPCDTCKLGTADGKPGRNRTCKECVRTHKALAVRQTPQKDANGGR